MKEKLMTVNEDKIFIGEEDYKEQMLQKVLPFLDKNRRTGCFKSFDGKKIFYEAYEHSQEKATIVMSHGFCEFTKKFEEVIFYFLQEGYSVYIHDHRGHGYSQRSVSDRGKVHQQSYADYVQDLHVLITEVVLKEKKDRKLILYGHSMGGAIGALYLEVHPEVFTCAVLSSPMLQIDFGKTPSIIAWWVMLFKKLTHAEEEYVSGHGAFDGIPLFETSSCLSKARYDDIFSKRVQDENYQTYGASCGWTLASIRAVRKIKKYAKQIKVPILLFQAGKDTTVKSGGQNKFASKSRNTRLVVIAESKHEIYNADSIIRKEYYAKIFTFFEKELN